MLRSLLIAVVGCVSVASVVVAEPIKVTWSAQDAGRMIPSDFSGLSFETKRMLPDETYPGGHLFSAENTHLVAMMKALGVRSLRIGGNTADRANVPIPDNKDIDALFGFAKAAGTKVIYTLRMKDTAPESLVPTAKYLYERHAGQLSHLVVGNEPNVYYKTFEEYQGALAGHLKVISEAVPQVEFCGPCTTNAAPTWPALLAKNSAAMKVTLLAQHNYPAGNGQKATDKDAAVEKLLSDLSPGYVKLLGQLREGGHGLPVRLEETNNYYLGGAPNASDTFASALWGLDYLHWWAAQGIAGINFHASDYYPKTPDDKAVWYVPFSREGGSREAVPTWKVHPLGYAMKAFALATPEGAVSLKVELENPEKTNVTAYATRVGEVIFLTVVNKTSSEVSVTLPSGSKGMTMMRLEAPAANATSGITLGGGILSGTGEFKGEWADGGGASEVKVASTSAVLIRLR